MWTQHKLWLYATKVWADACDPLRAVLMCATGGLRPEQVRPLRERVRVAMKPGPDDDGKD